MRHKLANVLKIFFIMTLVLSLGCFFVACGGEDKPETPTKYTVTVVNGTGGGEYEENADATVTATIPEGKVFVKWTSDGQDVSTNNPYTFKVTKDITLTAVLDDASTVTKYTVTVEDGEGGGEYEEGEEVTVSPDDSFKHGKTFTGWFIDGEQVSDEEEYTFTVTEDVTIVAGAKYLFNNTVDCCYYIDEPIELDQVIAVDVKFDDGAAADGQIAICLRDNWDAMGLFGYYRMTVDGTLVSAYKGVYVKALEDGGFRLIFDLSKLDEKFYTNAYPANIGIIHSYPGEGYTTVSGELSFYGIYEEEVEPDIHDDAVAVSAAWASLEFEPLDNFAASGKALVFDYKATEDVTSGDDFQFTLWGAGWQNRRTWFVTVDVVNNTVDIGTVEELEDGWYRVTVPCNLLPINTEEGATGTESIGTMVFNTVNHSFLIDEVGAVDYVAPLPTKVMLTSGYEIDLPDYDPATAKTLEFDVYVTEERSAYAKVIWNLYDADNNYFGWYRVTYAGLQAADTSGYSVTEVSADSIIHVTFVLSELAGGSGTPGKLVKLADSGASARLDGCWIDNIAFYAEKSNYTVTVEGGTGGGTYQEGSNVTVTATVPSGKNFVEWQINGEKVSDSEEYTFTVTGDVTVTAIFEDAEAGDTKVMLTSNYEINLPDYNDATTLEFDVYATSGSPYAKVNIVFTDANGVSTKLYRVTYLGVNTGYNAEGVSCSQISENTWHVVMTLSELTNGSGTSLGKVVKMSDSGSSNLDGCWIDNIEFKA